MDAQDKDFIRGWLLDPKSDDECDLHGFSDLTVLEAVSDVSLNWSTIGKNLTHKFQDKILWRIVGFPIFAQFLLTKDGIATEAKINFIRCAKTVTLAVPLLFPGETPMEPGYFMWWDCIASELVEPAIAEACLEVLADLSRHPDERIQVSALHGLGHLQHPKRAAIVDEFIQFHPALASDKWVLQCRDGTVM